MKEWLKIEASALEKAEARSRAEREMLKAREMARKMIQRGRSLEEIAEYTELSIEELRNLSSEI